MINWWRMIPTESVNAAAKWTLVVLLFPTGAGDALGSEPSSGIAFVSLLQVWPSSMRHHVTDLEHVTSTKTECDTSMVGLKTVMYAKISPKMVNPRDIAGSAWEEEEHVTSNILYIRVYWQLSDFRCRKIQMDCWSNSWKSGGGGRLGWKMSEILRSIAVSDKVTIFQSHAWSAA